MGKTTTAAALAVEGARRGRRTAVITIDPARRLADTLGLRAADDHEVERALWDPDGDASRRRTIDRAHARHRLDLRRAGGSLRARTTSSATASSRTASTATSPSALSGTQEYMAMERLHELHETGEYDLIIVDTPPTRHALDFLDAPQRLIRLLDNRVLQDPDGSGAAGLPRRDGGAARVRAPSRPGDRHRGDRRHHLVLPRVRGHGGRVPGARRRGAGAAHRAVDELRARHFGAARLDRRGDLLRAAARRQRVRDQRADREPRAAAVRADARRRRRCGLVPPRCAARRRPGPTPGPRPAVSPTVATPWPTSPRSRRGSTPTSRAWPSRWVDRRWRSCRSWRTTCTTSTALREVGRHLFAH